MKPDKAKKRNNDLRIQRIKNWFDQRHVQERIIEEDVLAEIADHYCIEIRTVKSIVRGWKK